MKAKEMFEKLDFEQFCFDNDKNSITIGYQKVTFFMAAEMIGFACYKNKTYDSNGLLEYNIHIQADLYLYDSETSKYEPVGGLAFNTTLLNAINKQVEELKQIADTLANDEK